MADLTGKTINELPAAGYLSGGELFPVSVNGSAKKLSFDSLKDNLPIVGYVDDASARADISINSAGYATINPPSGFPSGAKALSVSAITWGTNVAISFVISGANSNYAFVNAPGGTTLQGLQTRWWYVI